MQTNPVVSEFSLQPQQQMPPQQLLIRSRFNQSAKSALSRSICPPNEVLVHVRPSFPLQSAQNNGIRSDIDACLNAVEQAYTRRNRPQQNFIPQRSRVQQEAIHRIDSNIIMDYVSTVYRDYGIRNRFGHFDPNSIKRSTVSARPQSVRVQNAIKQEPLRKEVRPERGSWSRPSKQYLNVTQQSKISKRDVSFSSQKKEGIVLTRPHRQTLSSHESPGALPDALSSRMPQTSIKRSQLMGKFREDFRYCVNCEKAVLSLNADFHEQFQCPNFDQLYTLSFKSLAELVQGKVNKMRQQLRRQLSVLREGSGRGNTKGVIVVGNLVDFMQEYACEGRVQVQTLKDEIREEQRRLKYNLFRESLNNSYSEAVELTHKLHWFQQISVNLRRQQEKTHETTNKTEEGKALQCIRMLTPNASHRQGSILFSPVNYLHPYLHRQRHM